MVSVWTTRTNLSLSGCTQAWANAPDCIHPGLWAFLGTASSFLSLHRCVKSRSSCCPLTGVLCHTVIGTTSSTLSTVNEHNGSTHILHMGETPHPDLRCSNHMLTPLGSWTFHPHSGVWSHCDAQSEMRTEPAQLTSVPTDLKDVWTASATSS